MGREVLALHSVVADRRVLYPLTVNLRLVPKKPVQRDHILLGGVCRD